MKTNFLFPIVVLLSVFWAYSYNPKIPEDLDTSPIMPDEVKDSIRNELDLFASKEPIEMTLSAYLREFVGILIEPEYQPFCLMVKLNDEDSLNRRVKPMERGFMRT